MSRYTFDMGDLTAYMETLKDQPLTSATPRTGKWISIHGDKKSRTAGQFESKLMEKSDGKYLVGIFWKGTCQGRAEIATAEDDAIKDGLQQVFNDLVLGVK